MSPVVIVRSLLTRLSIASSGRFTAATQSAVFQAAVQVKGSFSNRREARGFSKKKDIDEDDIVADDDPEIIVPTAPSTRANIDALSNDDDPFGVYFDDGSEEGKIGKQLPPKYKRDSATGRLTGDIEKELSEEERRVLKADPLEKDQILLSRLERHWENQGLDSSGMPNEVFAMGRRVRDANMGLNVLGRSVKAQASEEELDDGSTLGRDESGFSQNLTKQEYEAFAEYMKGQHHIEIMEEDIPVQASQKGSAEQNDPLNDPDDLALSLRWLSDRAKREMDDLLDDNPYSDLMPGDLSPARLVNRKRAKPIPVKLLHHNNIDLLRRFLTPTGQIMNRVQSRLGARDQRRVAKLVKRARALGLMPYAGQVKVENHGWRHAPNIHKDLPWEKELQRRGLVIKRSQENTDRTD